MYDINKLKELGAMFNVEVDLFGEDQDKLQMVGTNGDINKFFAEAKRQGLLGKDPFDESYNYDPEDASWMYALIDTLRVYPSNDEIENDVFLKELRDLYYKHYPDSDKIIEGLDEEPKYWCVDGADGRVHVGYTSKEAAWQRGLEYYHGDSTQFSVYPEPDEDREDDEDYWNKIMAQEYHGEETLMERMDYDTLYKKIKYQDNLPVKEGLMGTLLFNTSFANELYDEFYRPLTDLIKKGDKEGAMKEWEDLNKDLQEDPRMEKKWAKTFIEVQKDRLEKYKAEIDAMEDAKVEEFNRYYKDSGLTKDDTANCDDCNDKDPGEGLDGSLHIQYCPACGCQNDYSDSQDNGSWVRYTCRNCGNTWDIDKPMNEDAGLSEDDTSNRRDFDDKDLNENLVKDPHYDSLAINEPKIYLPTDKGNKVEVSIGAEKQDEDDWDIYVEIRDNGDFCFEIPSSRLADEIDEIRNPRLTYLTYERAEELCDLIHSYFEEIDQDDIYTTLVNKLGCNKTKVEKFWNAPNLQDDLNEGATVSKPHTKRLLKLIGSDKLNEATSKSPNHWTNHPKWKTLTTVYGYKPEDLIKVYWTEIPADSKEMMDALDSTISSFVNGTTSIGQLKHLREIAADAIDQEYADRYDSDWDYEKYPDGSGSYSHVPNAYNYDPALEAKNWDFSDMPNPEDYFFELYNVYYFKDNNGLSHSDIQNLLYSTSEKLKLKSHKIDKFKGAGYFIILSKDNDLIFDDEDPLYASSYDNLIAAFDDAVANSEIDTDLEDFWDDDYEESYAPIPEDLDDEPIQESYFEDEPSWLDDDDPVEADREHANLYGGDRTYCDTCGSRLAMDEWGSYCPKCNPQELEETFDKHIDLDAVAIRVANLLDEENLGDNWIEFDYKDSRGLIGSDDQHLAFEAIGESKILRGYMRGHADNTVTVYITNGSEALCRTPEEIARFIAGEFGLAL